MDYYFEEPAAAKPYRENYMDGLSGLLADRYRVCTEKRDRYIAEIRGNEERYRQEFCDLFGYPLNEYDSSKQPPEMAVVLLFESEKITIKRITLEVLPGLPLTGLLLLHEDGADHPFVISQHGGSGTAEICSGIYTSGTANYNDMSMRIFRAGANVFAPQLLLWNSEIYGTPYNRLTVDRALKQTGSSITAVEIYALRRSLDAFIANKTAKLGHIGMAGLSYGGFYTLFTAAAEPRIRAAISCAFFNDRVRYNWEDWTWFGAAEKFLDAETALLVWPRKLWIAVGSADEAFGVETAEKEFKRLEEISQRIYGDTSWVHFCKFEGNHEFIKDDAPILDMIGEIKSDGICKQGTNQ